MAYTLGMSDLLVYKDQANRVFYASAPPHFRGFLLIEGNAPSLKTWTWTLGPTHLGFPGGSGGTESACNAGYPGPIPGLGRFSGEGMTTHSRILAWRIPWTEETRGLQSMGSQRVRQGWPALPSPPTCSVSGRLVLHSPGPRTSPRLGNASDV